MTKIYHIKRVPVSVKHWFTLNFPPSKGFTYNFYVYKINETKPLEGDNKVYGCEVSKNGEFHHNATQGTEKWFSRNKNNKTHG